MAAEAWRSARGDHLERAAERVAALPPRRAARVSLVEGDMRGPLPLGPAGPFDRILIPYNGLFCLLAPGEQLACLKAARAVAAPDCHLLLDAYVIDEAALDPSPPGEGAADENEHVLTVLTPEGRVEVYEQNFEAPGQRIDALYTLELTDDAGETRTLTQRIGHKFLLPREVEPLLTEAGWRTIGFHGGFRGAKFTDRSALMVITAENPGGAPHHP